MSKLGENELTEKEQSNSFPTWKHAEEVIASYGQIILWLRNCAEWSEDSRLKQIFTLSWKSALREFAEMLDRTYMYARDMTEQNYKEKEDELEQALKEIKKEVSKNDNIS
jgi:hypothetical protein